MARTLTKNRRSDGPSVADSYMHIVTTERDGQALDEAKMRPPIRLGVKAKYLFRSKPGTYPRMTVKIPALPEQFRDRDQRETEVAKYKQRFDEKQRKTLEHVRTVMNGNFIHFTPTPRGECFFATDDDKVADFLKSLLHSGREPWTKFYLELPGRTVTINGEEFPNTALGWEAARRYMMDNDQDNDLVFVPRGEYQVVEPDPEDVPPTDDELE